MKKSKSGFTIVELLVVVVVIGILAGIVLVTYNGVQGRSRDSRRKTDITNLVKAMELYHSDNGTYPIPTSTTGSSLNGQWYVSSDGSWNMLSTALVGSEAIDATPSDPINTPANPTTRGNYAYGIYVNMSSYCGAAPGQMYIIIWRYETMPKERTTTGNCKTLPIGDSYFNSNGMSYYRNSRV